MRPAHDTDVLIVGGSTLAERVIPGYVQGGARVTVCEGREAVGEDGALITSRKPDDLPAFCAALLRQVDQGIAPRLEASKPAAAAPVDSLPSIH